MPSKLSHSQSIPGLSVKSHKGKQDRGLNVMCHRWILCTCKSSGTWISSCQSSASIENPCAHFQGRSSLSINALHACVYIYIGQLGSFRAPMWFINLTVTTCHIQIHFSEFMSIFFMRKWTKHKNTQIPPVLYDVKMATDG